MCVTGTTEAVGSGRRRPSDKISRKRVGVGRVTRVRVLAASIAHEVKQPLSAIVTNGATSLRWLARPEPDVEKIRERIRCMVADARRAAEILDGIQAMANRREPKRMQLLLDDVVQESAVFLCHEFRSMEVSVALDLAPNPPHVAGDRGQLQQVIVNLAINAVQAMARSGGRNILFRTLLPNPGTVCCTIEDSGPGIDPAYLPRLFDVFFTTKDTGMGMGLAISRSIIAAHDGHIEADNNSVLGGARFSISLPTIGQSGRPKR
jgi:C4-dicarboxylate-specific signal transduction histidine kinase